MESESVRHETEDGHDVVYQQAVCNLHGEFEDKIYPALGRGLHVGCPACSKERSDQADRESAENARIERDHQFRVKMSMIGVPVRYREKSLSTYEAKTAEQKSALSTCVSYVDGFEDVYDSGRCMLMLGKPGTGKTHLGISVAKAVAELTDHTTRYRSMADVIRDIRSSFDGQGELREFEIINSLITPGLLVLDEIGASKQDPSDFELSTIFQIINGRYERRRPTIIISNLGPRELSKAMGERATDRLREGGAIVLPFSWESQRGKEGI